MTGEIFIQSDEPPPSATPPFKIKVEHGDNPGDLNVLKKDIKNLMRSSKSAIFIALLSKEQGNGLYMPSVALWLVY